MKPKISSKQFHCRYQVSLRQQVCTLRPGDLAGMDVPLDTQMNEWFAKEDVFPVTTNLGYGEIDSNGILLGTMTVVYMSRAEWEQQQAEIRASADAIREARRMGLDGMPKVEHSSLALDLKPNNIKFLMGANATTANILDALNWLKDGVVVGDKVLFYFRGHGATVPDTDGDEPD
jgi:hypothetical protein